MAGFFDGIVQQDLHGPGFDGKLPCFYYDTLAISAVFTASTPRIVERLPDPDLHPLELRRGRCLFVISGLEHRRTDIGPYSELIIGPMVAFGRRPVRVLDPLAELIRHSMELYALHLPVTTEAARYAGVELYGFPKIIADVLFARGPNQIVCDATYGGARILTLAGDELRLYGSRRTHVKLYSRKDGATLRADVELNQREFAQTFRRHAATLDLGDHAIGRDLAKLDLDPRPVLYQASPFSESILFGPQPARAARAKVRVAEAPTASAPPR